MHVSPSATPAPPLLLVAHGSRDPRHGATVTALAERLRHRRPELRVETAYLDLTVPRVPTVLQRLADAGTRSAVAVPLLLTRAFHARADLPAVLRESLGRLPGLTVRQADVLGPHPLLLTALERRLRQAGLRPADRSTTGVVLAAAGSSDPRALAVIADLARRWRRAAGWGAVRPAFASASPPTTAEAVRALRAEGVRRVAVAPYVLAPGRLPDRIGRGAREAGADVLAAPLGDAPEVAEVVLRRYTEALTTRPGLPLAASA